MFDQQDIERAALKEVFRQMASAVMIVRAPSGEGIFNNSQSQQMSERYLGSSVLLGVGDLRNLYESGVFELVRPDGRVYEFEEWPIMRSLRAGEEVRDEELVQRIADGRRLSLRCNSSPLYDEEGSVVACALVVHDITEQRRAEEQLSYHTFLLENIYDAVLASDEQAGLTAWNKGAEQMFGWTADEVLGRKVYEVIPYTEYSDEQLAESLRRLAETGRRRTEAIWHHKDGTPVYGEALTIALPGDQEGRITGYVSIIRDITERKWAEEGLREREERFRATFEQAAVGMAQTAPDGKLLKVNQKLCDILGYANEELLEMTVQERTHPEDLDKDLEQAQQLLAGEIGTYSMEKRLLGKDDSIVWINLTVSLVRDTWGEPNYLIAVVEDIDQRKQAEEALRESSRQTKNILESITNYFYALDSEWRFTYINERAKERIQREEGEEFLGKNIWELYPELVDSPAYDKYHEALREQKSVEFEMYSPVTNRWIELHVYPSMEGVSVYFQDIHERKQAEQEIETRTHQQAVVAELGQRALTETNLQLLMDEAVALVAQTLRVEYVKIMEPLPGNEEMLMRAGAGWREGLVGRVREPAGLRSEAGYAMQVEEPLIVEDLSTGTRFEPSELIREHGIVSGMSVVIHGQEEPLGVLSTYTTSRRIFTEDDANFLQAVANVLATAIQRKDAEDSLEEVREVERSRIARDLHDDALQDLTNALVKVQFVQSISKDPEVSRQLGQLLAVLDRMGPHLRGAIYDLRLKAEQDRPFSELLKSLVELQRTMAPECEIRLQIGEGIPEGALGKTGREVLRIVGEALTNARRHSRAPNILVSVRTEEETLSVEVSDDGRGFHPEKEPLTATTTGGMGIKGMRERTRALGADLKIQSEPGRGTKVRLKLALNKEREQPEEAVRVLLVEDHTAVRESLASTFEREAGFNVVGQAGSLAQARQMLHEAEYPVDVGVVDLGLPDGYGGDLIKELREASPQAQALVLSASLDRAEIARAVERGAAGIVHKTAHLDEVVEAVRRLRAGETLLPLEEVVELLRFAGSEREQEYEARKAIALLTPRERDVLQALAEGLDSEGIAERLHIALRTERNHMASILAKLGVHSQLQALVFALRHGVVEIP